MLRPDYRSSGQLGWDAYIRAKNAGTILASNSADIESGVRKLIAQGSVDPKRIVIIGLSYGGVMTNYIGTHSTLFSAAITYEGFDYFTDWAGGRNGPTTTSRWNGKWAGRCSTAWTCTRRIPSCPDC